MPSGSNPDRFYDPTITEKSLKLQSCVDPRIPSAETGKGLASRYLAL